MADLFLKKEAPAIKMRIEQGASLFFSVILVLFFITAASYGGLIFLSNAQDKTRQDIVDQIRLKGETLRPELLRQIFILDNRLKNLKTLLSAHPFITNVFGFLEAQTLPQVRYLNFNFTADGKRLDLDGETPSYAMLARQITVFEKNQEIESVDFGGLSFQKNQVGFKLSIVFKPTFLQLR